MEDPKIIKTIVKGISFLDDRRKIMSHVRIHEKLSLVREPTNVYDSNAIKVIWRDQAIGYIPKEIAENIAPLMDRGEIFNIVVYDIEEFSDKIHITISKNVICKDTLLKLYNDRINRINEAREREYKSKIYKTYSIEKVVVLKLSREISINIDEPIEVLQKVIVGEYDLKKDLREQSESLAIKHFEKLGYYVYGGPNNYIDGNPLSNIFYLLIKKYLPKDKYFDNWCTSFHKIPDNSTELLNAITEPIWIFRNDLTQLLMGGEPDLFILDKRRENWFECEVKKDETIQPNQIIYYVIMSRLFGADKETILRVLHLKNKTENIKSTVKLRQIIEKFVARKTAFKTDRGEQYYNTSIEEEWLKNGKILLNNEFISKLHKIHGIYTINFTFDSNNVVE